MKITTTYKSNANGTGQILAKGGGKQKTVEYDHALSTYRNHGSAAGQLARRLFPQDMWESVARSATHAHVGDGKHVFNV